MLLDTRAGALPGKSLVVLEPALGLATDIFPCEDGHAQERSLLPEVLETVEAGDLWIGERNFCKARIHLEDSVPASLFSGPPTSKPSLDS